MTHGKGNDVKNMPLIMFMHNCSYAATASLAIIAGDDAKFDKALKASRTGLARSHVYPPCPSGWRIFAARTIDICRLMAESNFITLWEWSPDPGGAFTRSIDNPLPIETYLNVVGTYRHLEPAPIAMIEAQTKINLEGAMRFVKKREEG